MRTAKINSNGLVENIIVATLEEAQTAFPNDTWVEVNPWIDIGININAPKPIIVPTTVSMRQARLALFEQGKLSEVQPLIDAMQDPDKTNTQISWDYATVVNRSDDLVVQLSAAMGLTNSDLDALFILADTL